MPILIRGLYYEGRAPSKAPIKMSRQECLDTVQEKIVAGRVIDPLETVQSVFSVVAGYVGRRRNDQGHAWFPTGYAVIFSGAGVGGIKRRD